MKSKLLEQYLGVYGHASCGLTCATAALFYGLVIWNKGMFSLSSVKSVHCLGGREEVRKLKGIQ